MDKSYKHGWKKKNLNRKAKKESFGFDADTSKKNVSGHGYDGTAKSHKSWKHHSSSEPQTSVVRKQVDPDLAKYFSEIANLFESNEADLEERSVLCRNALEETRGKEFELATDYIISHTLQTLLEGCDVDHLCGFLRGCAKVFPAIAMDRSGSHVAETALKSLAVHIQDEQNYSVVEETLTMICKVSDVFHVKIRSTIRFLRISSGKAVSCSCRATALKLLLGHDEELLKIIPVLLGCKKENIAEGNFIDMSVVSTIVDLMKETAYSHLMEVILEVAPESMYNEMFTKVFRNSLFHLSSHQCANFVVQALISHARDQDQMELIWKELGAKFRELLEMGRSGVIAALIAACQRLHTHEQKCCQGLAAAVGSTNESPRSIIPRILFLESYLSCEDKSNWNWPNGFKIHVIGSLILQGSF
ncbi:hypothetical protein Patl1_33863 [Pistacia atlantica]|uniref:Uncharacterized protein n=1 Tax=Pistacia atlantica TaxID=434234 RepID=A0ACC0ZV81_9ROSI|nr:hypothetical protein Patl1_33863 [Pistacia atlantica]